MRRAALGRRELNPATTALNVQIFGRRDSRDTQKAVRFFRERRIEVSFVDIARKPPAPAELRRFVQRFGAAALLDTMSRAYREAGLAYLSMDEEGVLARVNADPDLLRLPLVRAGTNVSVGVDEEAWRGWIAAASD